MAARKKMWRGLGAAALSVGLSAALAPAAQAGEWEFTLQGVFNGTTSGATPPTDTLNAVPGGANVLTANEPFTLTAVFNSSNIVFNMYPGFNAYGPSSVTLTVGGQVYSVETYGQSSTSGLTVALFDPTYGAGHVAAGFLANPPHDGAGIIGDFTSSTPTLDLSNLAQYPSYQWPTSAYFGVGFGSGPCPSGFDPASGACIPSTDMNTVVPIPLDGDQYELTLGTYDLNNPSNTIPVNPNFNLFSASLTSVPEPSTWALLLIGFAGLASAGLRIGRKAPLAG